MYFFFLNILFGFQPFGLIKKEKVSCHVFIMVVYFCYKPVRCFPSIHFLTPQSHLRAIMIRLYFLLLNDYHVLTVFRSGFSFIYLFSFGLK